MENVVKECNCIGVCHSKSKYPSVYIKRDCQHFEQNVKCIERCLKERADIKSKPQDDPKVQSDLSTNDCIIAASIQAIYRYHSLLEKCTYANQFVKNTDYGKKYLDLKKNSEIVDKIMSLGVENMEEIFKNPPYYIDTYLQ